MTLQERGNPELLSASRKLRIAKGSGKTLYEVNLFLKQFNQMRKMMHKMTKMPNMGNMAMPGGGGKSGMRRR
jgi:signal recognition particle subunit SRP54